MERLVPISRAGSNIKDEKKNKVKIKIKIKNYGWPAT